MTKVDIISGFLGAGKTTLIRRLLQDALKNEKVVLIENEFGEIGVDGGFLKDAGVEIKEMNSGCICCSLVGDFEASLKEVIKTYHPDRIIIEPSGVGLLSDVMKAVNDAAESCQMQLNSHSTIVDVNKVKMYLRNFGEFYKNQLAFASTIILSRTDLANVDKVKKAVALIRQHNEDAQIITTPVAALGGKKVLEVMENDIVNLEKAVVEAAAHGHDKDCACGCHGDEGHHQGHHHEHDKDCTCGCHGDEEHHQGHHHEHGHKHGQEGHEHHHHQGHHHADEVFASWGCESISKYSKEDIRRILAELEKEEYGMVLRAKGMLPDEEGNWHYFDMVPGEAEVRSGSPEFTGRICVIGAGLKEDKLKELFGAM